MATLQDAVSAVVGVTWLPSMPEVAIVGAAWQDSTGLHVVLDMLTPAGSSSAPMSAATITAALASVVEYADASPVEAWQSFGGRITTVGSWTPVVSAALVGDPTAPTPTAGDDDTSVATTEFVTDAIATSAAIERATSNDTYAAVYKPEKYGAVGDGTTDDSAAFIAMLAAIDTAGSGTVDLEPTKIYRCDSQLAHGNGYLRITCLGGGGVVPSGLAGTQQTSGARLDLRYAGRDDTVGITNGSATVTDALITANDRGFGVTGPGIPTGTYVGTVTPGVSFLLSSSPSSQVNVTATATGTVAAHLNLPKFLALYMGILEIDNIAVVDRGTSSNPFIWSTIPVPRIHDCLFQGNIAKSGGTCDQDAITLGGPDGSPVVWHGADPNSPFAGYGGFVARNTFSHIRRGVHLGNFANNVWVYHNTTDVTCGSNQTIDAPIVIDCGTPNNVPANEANGNVIRDNLIELAADYAHAIILRNGAVGNIVQGNGIWDWNPGKYVSDVLCDEATGAQNNSIILDGYSQNYTVTGVTPQSCNNYIVAHGRPSAQQINGPVVFGTGGATNAVSGDIVNINKLIFGSTNANSGVQRIFVAGNTLYLQGGTGGLQVKLASAATAMAFPAAGGAVVGAAALATTATDGFLYLPTCAGVPTGVPTAQTGTVPMVVDTTDGKLYVYTGGSWKSATLT
jgi:hypothetical protein